MTDVLIAANNLMWMSSNCYPAWRWPGHIWSSSGRILISRNMAASTRFWLPVHCKL